MSLATCLKAQHLSRYALVVAGFLSDRAGVVGDTLKDDLQMFACAIVVTSVEGRRILSVYSC
jgi:hypothetical protein